MLQHDWPLSLWIAVVCYTDSSATRNVFRHCPSQTTKASFCPIPEPAMSSAVCVSLLRECEGSYNKKNEAKKSVNHEFWGHSVVFTHELVIYLAMKLQAGV